MGTRDDTQYDDKNEKNIFKETKTSKESVRSPSPPPPPPPSPSPPSENGADSKNSMGSDQGLKAIRQRDSSFDSVRFLETSKEVYILISKAYVEHDRSVLKNLVTKDVLAGFEEAMREREKAGTRLERRIVHFNYMAIKEGGISGDRAQITVCFEVDLLSCTRDAKGNIVEGCSDIPSYISDLWTFERNVTDSSPVWRLIETDTA